MPVQRFAPMTKDFATFDCDAHVTEPPLIWERAKDFLTRDELDALKRTIWWDADSRLLIVNGRAGIGLGSPRKGGIPGTMRVITNAGPGVKHDIQRALNVRNLNPKTALTQEQVAYLDHAGSYEPKPRLKDMDIQGIDQVMIIPTEIDIYPWLEDALGAKAFCRAYNEWAYEYTLGRPRTAVLRRADPDAAPRLRGRGDPPGRRAGLPGRTRPPDGCDGQLPAAAEIRAGVGRARRDRHGLRHAPVPGLRQLEALRLQRAVFRRRTDPQDDRHRRPAAHVPDQCAEFPGRSGAVGHDGADVGLFRAAPEDQRRGVRGVLDLAQLPDRRMRQGLSALSATSANCRR